MTSSKSELNSAAHEAVRHARASLPTGADNWESPAPNAHACVVGARADHPTAFDWNVAALRWFADDAREAGCGNCGEHAAVAFVFLYDRGIRPVEYREESGTHAFVVIGDGANAVAVDAWMDQVKPLRELDGVSTVVLVRAD